MKSLSFIITLLILTTFTLNAQRWLGPNNSTGNIHRAGKVGIGITNPATKLHVNGYVRGNINGALRIHTGKGYVDIGPQNTGWAHIYTDRAKFIFNKSIVTQGGFSSYGNKNLLLQTNGTNRLVIKSNGQVGIGTATPNVKLHVIGNIRATGYLKAGNRTVWLGDVQRFYGDNNSALYFKSNNSNTCQMILQDKENKAMVKLVGYNNGNSFCIQSTDNSSGMYTSDDNYTVFKLASQEKMRLKANGNVGINTTTPDYKLDVNGTVRAKEVRVQSGWSDHVFLPEYQLPTLQEEEQFINQNGHLIGFESEGKMDGEIKLADVTNRQQETIEKLMLHVIELKKEIETLKEQLK